MNYNIREVQQKDLTAVLQLIQELADYEKALDEVSISLEELSKDYANNLFRCLIAECEGQIIGMALFYNRYSTWKGKTIHLEDLIVTKDCRGKGVGKALLDAVVGLAKKENLRRVEWNVLDWNTPAITFYKNVGANILKSWYVVQLDENGIELY
ncbi:MAG: GNAT family N-acetyltransferase [Flavobacteriaceae bacterium]